MNTWALERRCGAYHRDMRPHKVRYNEFHLRRIADMVAGKDSVQNMESGAIMRSSTWSEADRLKWAIDSFAELQFEGFDYRTVTERMLAFKSQIKSLADAQMWHDVLKQEFDVTEPMEAKKE